MEYKKLFDIKYNNKTFTLFLSENKRIAFLEKRDQDKYYYPNFDDFKALNTIFNVHNPFVFYDNKKVFFKEKVLLASGILAIVMSIVPLFGLNAEYKVDEEQGIVYVTPTNTLLERKTFTNIADLDEILGYTEVSKEEIMNAIDNNPNLSEYYKIIARNLVNKYLEVVPNVDLRMFYENIKTLKIVELSEDSEQEIFGDYISGTYNSYDNQITLKKDSTLAIIYHEFAHMTQNYCKMLDDHTIIWRSAENKALDEAMNNKIVELITNDYSYLNERLVLNYLLTFVDYTLEDYNKYGIDELINRLKDKYPNIDYDCITHSTNAFTNLLLYLGIEISMEENVDLLDELFNLALASINLDGYVYEPFINFVKLFKYSRNEELINSYLEKYNDYLISLNYTDIITPEQLNEIGNQYQDFENIVFYQNEFYIANKQYDDNHNPIFKIIKGNQIQKIDNIDKYGNLLDVNKYVKLNYLKYKDIYGTQEFWTKMLEENDLIIDHLYKKISIYLNGEFITEDYIDDLLVVLNKDEFGNISYSLSKWGDPNIMDCLYETDLKSYSSLYNFKDKLELSYIFNDAYLKRAIQERDLFINVIYADDKITFLTDYILYFEEDEKYYYLDECNLINSNGKIVIPELDIEIDKVLPTNDPISLYEVFDYCNYLYKGMFKYQCHKEDIIHMINEYVDNYNLNYNSQPSK